MHQTCTRKYHFRTKQLDNFLGRGLNSSPESPLIWKNVKSLHRVYEYTLATNIVATPICLTAIDGQTWDFETRDFALGLYGAWCPSVDRIQKHKRLSLPSELRLFQWGSSCQSFYCICGRDLQNFPRHRHEITGGVLHEIHIRYWSLTSDGIRMSPTRMSCHSSIGVARIFSGVHFFPRKN